MTESSDPASPTFGKQNPVWPTPRQRLVSFLVAAALLPILFYGAVGAWKQSGTKVDDWLPASFPETARLREFERLFGTDELLVIGWDQAKIGDPLLEALREKLLRPDDHDEKRRRFFSEVWTGDTVLTWMQDEPLNLTSGQARNRMRGWILGEDERTVAIAMISSAGREDRSAAVGFARRVTQDLTGYPIDSLRMAGPTMNAVAIDEASKSSLLRLNVYSAIVCFVLLLVCTKSIRYTIIIYGIALYCEQAAMALIYYSGGQMDNVLLLTANLAGVLSMSAAIHAYGYYRGALQNSAPSPVSVAFRKAFVPTALAALTTGVGFISLRVSDVVPVRNFGFYSAIAAPVAVLVTLWYLCMFLRCTPRSDRSGVSSTISSINTPLSTGRFPLGRPLWPAVLLVSIVAILVGGVGAGRIQTAVGLHDLLPDEDRLLDDYRRLEEEIGPLVPIEVVVTIPQDEESTVLSEVRLISTLRKELLLLDGIDSALSAINFIPPIPSDAALRGVRGIVARAAYENRLERSLEEFTDLRMLHLGENERAWRISVRIYGGIEQDYTALLEGIDSAVKLGLQDHSNGKAHVSVSGIIPLATKTQHRLLSDFGRSFLTAIVLIGITVALVLRSLVAGILTMLPNVGPAAIVFGTMGWMQWPTEIGGVMTASAVLGIAVDDSLHLIMAFRSSHRRGRDRKQAVRDALATCRPAMVQTSLVCGLGMLVFVLSPFTPIEQFAWLMFALLAVALLADVMFLPAILESPLGRYFASRQKP